MLTKRECGFSDTGAVSIRDDDIVACYADLPVGRYCSLVLCLADGREIAGTAHITAVQTIQAKLAEASLPPAA